MQYKDRVLSILFERLVNDLLTFCEAGRHAAQFLYSYVSVRLYRQTSSPYIPALRYLLLFTLIRFA